MLAVLMGVSSGAAHQERGAERGAARATEEIVLSIPAGFTPRVEVVASFHVIEGRVGVAESIIRGASAETRVETVAGAVIGQEHPLVAIEIATEVSTGLEHPPVAIETAVEAAIGPEHLPVATETAAGATIGQEHPHVARETAAGAVIGQERPPVTIETAAEAAIGQEHPHVVSVEREDDVELAAAGVMRLPDNANRSRGGHSTR